MKVHFDRERLEKNLSDAYNKGPESNLTKILRISRESHDELRASNALMDDSLDLDKATGKTLDLYGEMIGQSRGAATDEQYRVLIKSRIIRYLAGADYNSIVKALATTFNCSPAEFLLTELDEPCRVKLEGLPIDTINASNIDINTAVSIVRTLIPAGVYMETLTFDGTFEFGGTEMEYDASAGFADNAQTIGGYLGYTSSGAAGELPV